MVDLKQKRVDFTGRFYPSGRIAFSVTLVRIMIIVKLIKAAVMEVKIFACFFKKNPPPP